MRKCEKCKKNILFGKICSTCKQHIIWDLQYAPKRQEFYNEQFDKENMLIGYYANIISSYIDIIWFMYKDLEYVPEYKNQIEPNNFEEAKKIYINKLKYKVDKIKQEKIKLLEQTGEVKYYTALVGLEEDIKDTIKTFPEFKNILKYDDLEKILNQ